GESQRQGQDQRKAEDPEDRFRLADELLGSRAGQLDDRRANSLRHREAPGRLAKQTGPPALPRGWTARPASLRASPPGRSVAARLRPESRRAIAMRFRADCSRDRPAVPESPPAATAVRW